MPVYGYNAISNHESKLLEKAEREKHIKKLVDVIFFGLTILESIAVGILTKHVSIGLIGAIISIILAIIALRECKSKGERGKKLCIAVIIVSAYIIFAFSGPSM